MNCLSVTINQKTSSQKNSRQTVSNYRPISILPVCGQIFGKIMYDPMYDFLNSKKLIFKNQSGFRTV